MNNGNKIYVFEQPGSYFHNKSFGIIFIVPIKLRKQMTFLSLAQIFLLPVKTAYVDFNPIGHRFFLLVKKAFCSHWSQILFLAVKHVIFYSHWSQILFPFVKDFIPSCQKIIDFITGCQNIVDLIVIGHTFYS